MRWGVTVDLLSRGVLAVTLRVWQPARVMDRLTVISVECQPRRLVNRAERFARREKVPSQHLNKEAAAALPSSDVA